MNTLFAYVSRYWNKHIPIILLLGISSGLPLLLVFGTLSIWLREIGVDRASITFFSWAGLAYGFKFIWSPLIDHIPIPFLHKYMGQRRSWLFVAQLFIMLALLIIASTNPADSQLSLWVLAIGAILLGFFSATQDIVIDAYRIEIAPAKYQAMLAGVAVAGYRVGMLVGGAGALEISAWFDVYPQLTMSSWQIAYFCMAIIMSLALVTTWFIAEPNSKREHNVIPNLSGLSVLIHFMVIVSIFIALFANYSYWSPFPHTFIDNNGVIIAFLSESFRFAMSLLISLFIGWKLTHHGYFRQVAVKQLYIDPFAEFFIRYGRISIWIVLLICLNRSPDIIMGIVAKIFYFDIGYSKSEISRISFGFGMIVTILGGIAGGVLGIRIGVLPILLIGVISASLSNLIFIYLANQSSPDINALILAISIDNFSSGFANCAGVAFISSIVNRQFSASQYAAFASITLLLPKLIAGYAGNIVDSVGYSSFFALTALLGLPVILLIIKIWKPYKQQF